MKPNLSDKWRSHLSQSRSTGLFSDIGIYTPDGSQFPAHKLVLGRGQWFFRDGDDCDAIILEGFSPSVVRHFLDILYSGLTKFTGEDNLRSLKELSEIFQVRNLSLETFVFEDDFEEDYYESDESEESGSHGLTVTLEENLSKRDILETERVEICPQKLEEEHEKNAEIEDGDFDFLEEEYFPDEEKPPEAKPCKYCSMGGFSSKTELNQHLFLCHAEARRCLRCNKEFKEPKGLGYHSKYTCPKIKRESFKCSSCESKFSSPRDARRHEKSQHGKASLIKCSQCAAVFKSPSFLSNHCKTAHNPRDLRFKCSACGKAFLKAAYLRDHIHRFHEPEKLFECKSCPKRFATKGDLQKHSSKAHEGAALLDCPICSQSFTYHSTLSHHIRSAHTGDKPYKCRPCNKGFGFLEVLKKHKKSHDRKGHSTHIVTAPKGQKGSKSYIDFSPSHQGEPSSSSFVSPSNASSTSSFAAASSSLCQDIDRFQATSSAQAQNSSFPNYNQPSSSSYPPPTPKSQDPTDQITSIDIMELLSKN